MLSAAQVVTIKKAKSRLYDGVMDVYEAQQTAGLHHDVITSWTKALSSVPCRLSFSQAPSADGKDLQSAGRTVKVFYDPDYEIKPGSRIEITQNGETLIFAHSGREAVYDTHRETELTEWEKRT